MYHPLIELLVAAGAAAAVIDIYSSVLKLQQEVRAILPLIY
jgi:hypothetical protein